MDLYSIGNTGIASGTILTDRKGSAFKVMLTMSDLVEKDRGYDFKVTGYTLTNTRSKNHKWYPPQDVIDMVQSGKLRIFGHDKSEFQIFNQKSKA